MWRKTAVVFKQSWCYVVMIQWLCSDGSMAECGRDRWKRGERWRIQLKVIERGGYRVGVGIRGQGVSGGTPQSKPGLQVSPVWVGGSGEASAWSFLRMTFYIKPIHLLAYVTSRVGFLYISKQMYRVYILEKIQNFMNWFESWMSLLKTPGGSNWAIRLLAFNLLTL